MIFKGHLPFGGDDQRLHKRLHVRGLIAKIPRTRRWRVTPHGQTVLGKLIRLHYHGLAQAA